MVFSFSLQQTYQLLRSAWTPRPTHHWSHSSAISQRYLTTADTSTNETRPITAVLKYWRASLSRNCEHGRPKNNLKMIFDLRKGGASHCFTLGCARDKTTWLHAIVTCVAVSFLLRDGAANQSFCWRSFVCQQIRTAVKIPPFIVGNVTYGYPRQDFLSSIYCWSFWHKITYFRFILSWCTEHTEYNKGLILKQRQYIVGCVKLHRYQSWSCPVRTAHFLSDRKLFDISNR